MVIDGPRNIKAVMDGIKGNSNITCQVELDNILSHNQAAISGAITPPSENATVILYYGKFPHLVSRVLKIEFGFNYEVFDKSLKGILEKMLHHPTVGDILKNDIPIDVSFMFCWDFVFGTVLFVIIYLFIFVFPVIIWGKTFGKKLMRLEIVHINGGYMDSFSVIKREMIGKTILFFGIVTVFFNKRRRALHDFLFGSLVVRYDDRVFNHDKKATFK